MSSVQHDRLLKSALLHLDGDLDEDDLATAVFLRAMASGSFRRLKLATWESEGRGAEISEAEMLLHVNGINHDGWPVTTFPCRSMGRGRWRSCTR